VSAKNPSSIFYWNDWENDMELKACSLPAQGLWMRLLCIAARSPEPGVVQIGNLSCSLPEGLPRLAAAVGWPLQEIVPLIDELIASGAAGRDRRGRIYSRRMKRDAALAVKRSESGRKGAGVTHGKTKRIEGLPWQKSGKPPGKPPGSSCLPPSELLHETDTGGVAARDGAAGWAERLDGYRPWDGVRTWSPRWGLPPDSAGNNPLIPGDLLARWRAKYGIEMARARAGSGRVETDG